MDVGILHTIIPNVHVVRRTFVIAVRINKNTFSHKAVGLRGKNAKIIFS